MNFNNGDNQQIIQINSEHHKLLKSQKTFLLIVTIEIHALILDVQVKNTAEITFYKINNK